MKLIDGCTVDDCASYSSHNWSQIKCYDEEYLNSYVPDRSKLFWLLRFDRELMIANVSGRAYEDEKS